MQQSCFLPDGKSAEKGGRHACPNPYLRNVCGDIRIKNGCCRFLRKGDPWPLKWQAQLQILLGGLHTRSRDFNTNGRGQAATGLKNRFHRVTGDHDVYELPAGTAKGWRAFANSTASCHALTLGLRGTFRRLNRNSICTPRRQKKILVIPSPRLHWIAQWGTLPDLCFPDVV